jgi:hypothetical protein
MDKVSNPMNSFKQVLNTAAVGAKLVAFMALDSSDKLNRFTNFITRGHVNRDCLAQSVVQFSVRAGIEYAIKEKLLGERSASLLPQAQAAFFNNELDQMKSAVEALAREGLSSTIDVNSGSSLARMGKKAVSDISSQAASKISAEFLGTHATEKLLHTMVNTHGWKPLDDYLQYLFSETIGGNFIAKKIHTLVDRAIVKNEAYNVGENAEYKLLASATKILITGEGNYSEPLYAYVGIDKSTLLQRSSELVSIGASAAVKTSLAIADVGNGMTAAGEGLIQAGEGLTTAGQQFVSTADSALDIAVGKGLSATGQGLSATGKVLTATGRGITATGHGLAALSQGLAAASAGLATASAELKSTAKSVDLNAALHIGLEVASIGLADAGVGLKLASAELVSAAGEGLSAAGEGLAAAGKGLAATGEGLCAVGVALASTTGQALTQASTKLIVAGEDLLDVGMQTATATNKAIASHVSTQIDSLQNKLVGGSASQPSYQAYRQSIETPGLLTNQPKPAPVLASELNMSTRDQDFADVLIKQTALDIALGQPAAQLKSIEKEIVQAQKKGTLDPVKGAQLRAVADSLSPAQIQPLSERSDISVAHNWSGRLSRIEAHNHAIIPLDDVQRNAAEKILATAPEATELFGNYKLSKAYAQEVGELDLQLPDDEYGAVDATGEAARTAINYGWGLTAWTMGYGDNSSAPTHAQSTEVRHLYNACAKNEKALEITSRYLSPELAKAALVLPTLEKMKEQADGTKLFDAGGTQLELENIDQPQYKFQVQRVDNLITVGVSAEWKIARFGVDADNMRSPQGEGKSHMSAGAIITIKLNPGNEPPTVNYTVLDVMVSVNNIISFDHQTGAKLD